MKRKYLVVLMALIGACVIVNARNISITEARETALSFLKANQAFKSRPFAETDIENACIENHGSYYSLNIPEEKGFLLISAQTDTPAILGFSDNGKFREENIPPQLKGALEKTVKSAKRRAKASSSSGILYATANWGQGKPFNDQVPNNAATGCVATAMSIVMNYHQWPDCTRGGLQSDWFSPEVKFDFDNYTIDWEALSDNKNNGFDSEVATLMKSAGVAINMEYGQNKNDESAALVWGVGMKLIELYAYDKECQYIEKEPFEDEEWNEMLIHQLDEIGPVIYRGGTDTNHCFVIDGYNSEGMYHINWGWDGNFNGYYALDFSDVGGLNFSENQGMVINIKPDKLKREYSKAFISNLNLYTYFDYTMSAWNFSQSKIDTGEKINFITPIVTLNRQGGFFCIGIVDENDNILRILKKGEDDGEDGQDYGSTYDDAPFCLNPGARFEFNLTMPPLKDGQRYQIVTQDAVFDPETGLSEPLMPSYDPKDFKILLGGILNPSYFYADGNTSEISTLKVHIDKEMPFLSTHNGTVDRDFTITKLRMGAFADNYAVPSKGVTMEVRSFDKNGNEKEPVYVERREDYYFNQLISFNISLYEPENEVYFHYIPSADTKRTDGLSDDQIIEDNGLIYKIEGETCCLIGYEPTIAEEARIPSTLYKQGKVYKVTDISNEALLHAPVTSLSVDGEYIALLRPLCFAGMKNLENVSLERFDDTDIYSWFLPPFLGSEISNVYSDSPLSSQYPMSLGGHYLMGSENYYIERPEINYFFSASPDKIYSNDLMGIFLNIYYYSTARFGIAGYNSFNIPGTGNYLAEAFDRYKFPINEMWQYSIDKENGLVRISNVMENITINSVMINGIEAWQTEEGCYCSSDDVASVNEVVVNYTANNFKEMTTVYDEEYNSYMQSENLAGLLDLQSSGRTYDLYNLQGTMIRKGITADELYSLPKGVYIYNGEKIMVK